MPIYLSGGIQQGGEPTEEFKERGLYGSGPARVEECGVFGIAKGVMLMGYLALINYIHLFAKAIHLSIATVRTTPFANVVQYVTNIPVTAPLLFVRANATMEDKELLRKYGMEDSPDSNKGCLVGRPSLQNVREMRKKFGTPDFGFSPAGNVNQAGYVSFFYAWQCIGVFMRVCGSRTQDVTTSWKYTAEGVTSFGPMGDKTCGLGYSADDRDVEFEEVEEGDMGATEIFNGGLLKVVIEPVNTTCNGFDDMVVDLQYTAKKKGHLFPYFKGMLIPSADFISTVVFRYFSKCLVDSEEAAAQLFPFLRVGFRSLYRTTQGLELQHIFFGIQLAIETGSLLRIFVQHGVYYGFAVLGDLTIIDHGRLIESLASTALNKEILELDIHGAAITKIIKMMVDMCGLKPEDIDGKKMVGSARYMNSIIVKGLRKMEGALPMGLEGEVRKTRFGQTYWDFTIDNIIIVIRAMISGVFPDPSAPMCIEGSLYKQSSILLQALAVFGPTAPSPINGTQKFGLVYGSKEDPNLVVSDKKRKLQYIPFYRKSVQAAAIDWNIVRDKKFIACFPPKKGSTGGFTDRSRAALFAEGKDFGHVYDLIRSFSTAFDVMDSQTGKKKRAIGEGEGGQGRGSRINEKEAKKSRMQAEDFF
jgi:hypothetical protein